MKPPPVLSPSGRVASETSRERIKTVILIKRLPLGGKLLAKRGDEGRNKTDLKQFFHHIFHTVQSRGLSEEKARGFYCSQSENSSVFRSVNYRYRFSVARKNNLVFSGECSQSQRKYCRFPCCRSVYCRRQSQSRSRRSVFFRFMMFFDNRRFEIGQKPLCP